MRSLRVYYLTFSRNLALGGPIWLGPESYFQGRADDPRVVSKHPVFVANLRQQWQVGRVWLCGSRRASFTSVNSVLIGTLVLWHWRRLCLRCGWSHSRETFVRQVGFHDVTSSFFTLLLFPFHTSYGSCPFMFIVLEDSRDTKVARLIMLLSILSPCMGFIITSSAFKKGINAWNWWDARRAKMF